MGSNGDSKLCADKPRHASPTDLWSAVAAQLGKGGEQTPPIASLPSVPPPASAETGPVSAPSPSRSGSERRQRQKHADCLRSSQVERSSPPSSRPVHTEHLCPENRCSSLDAARQMQEIFEVTLDFSGFMFHPRAVPRMTNMSAGSVQGSTLPATIGDVEIACFW
jgi:hypothetical protein